MPSLTKVQTGFLEAVNPLTLASGTASVPIISFSNSAATGIFSPYAGALGFSSGSTQNALTIIPDGKVGIGTTNPLYNTHIYGSVNGLVSLVVANKLNDVSSRAFFALENDTGGQGSLHFTGSTFANTGYARPSCLALYTSSANTSGGIAIAARNTSGYIDFYTGGANQRAIITSTGNVGIGTTNASSILHLYGAGQNIILDNSTSASVSGLKIRFQSNDSHGTQILYDPNAAITYFDNTYPVSTGTVYGDIRFRQNVSGTSTTRLVIKGDGGNIGIGGITNPAFAIDAGNATSNKAFRIGGLIGGNSGSSYAGIGYNAAPNGPNTWQYDTTDSSSWIQFILGSHVFYRAASGTAGTSITPLESARFDNSGNVGIGTNNPGTKLDVYGDIAINGTFALRRKDYGYSAIYKNVFIGSPDSVANTVSLCVDVSTISGGNFHGQNQVIIPRQGLLVPNNAGTNFVGVLSRDSNDYIRIGPDAPGGISGGPITVATSSVGIGTTNPGSKLVLAGFGANNTLRFADGAFEADIGYVDNTGNLTIQNWNDIIFRTGSSTRTEKVRILSSGNVGIGTTNPTSKLNVYNGDLELSGGYNLTWGGTFSGGNPTIWGNASNKTIRFAPDGNTTGLVSLISSAGFASDFTLLSTASPHQIRSYIDALKYFDVQGYLGGASYNGTSIGLASLPGFGVDLILYLGGKQPILPSGWTGTISCMGNANASSLGTTVLIQTSTDNSTWITRAQTANTWSVLLSWTQTTPENTPIYVRFRLIQSSGGNVGEGSCRVSDIRITNLYASPFGFAISNKLISQANHQFSTLSSDPSNYQALLVAGSGAFASYNIGHGVGFYSPGVASNSVGTVVAAINSVDEGAQDAQGLSFCTANTSIGSLSEKLRISNTGNVGIGTTNPEHPLEVNGIASLGTSGSYGYKIRFIGAISNGTTFTLPSGRWQGELHYTWGNNSGRTAKRIVTFAKAPGAISNGYSSTWLDVNNGGSGVLAYSFDQSTGVFTWSVSDGSTSTGYAWILYHPGN